MRCLPQVPLAELVEKVSTWRPDKEEPDQTFKYIDLSAVDQETKQIRTATTLECRSAPSRARQILHANDVLVSTVRPNLNGVAFVTAQYQQAIASTGFCVLRPIAEKLNSRYLFHWVKSASFVNDMVRKATGASYPAISDKIVSASTIPLPPVSEQCRIANVLDKAESLRTKRQETIAELDRLAQAIFVEMFGDPISDPMGWPRTTLGDLIEYGPQNGIYKPSNNYGSGTPILRIDGFHRGVAVKFEELKRVRIDEREIKAYGLSEGDIVINRVNSPEHLGKSAIIQRPPEPTVFESNMMRFSVNRKHAHPEFIFHFLQTDFIRAQIRSASKDAVNQSSINQEDVKSFVLGVPPLDMQMEFAERLQAINIFRTKFLSSFLALQEMQRALQQHAFQGTL